MVMSRVKSLVLLLAAAAAFGCLAFAQAEAAVPAERGQQAAHTQSTVFWSVVDLFKDFYWDPQRLDWDEWAARYADAAIGATRRAEFDSVMTRMIAAVGDDHSRWLGLSAAPDDPLAQQGSDELAPHDDADEGHDVQPSDQDSDPDPEADPAELPEELPDDGVDPALTRGLGLQVRYLLGAGIVVERVLPGTPASEVGLRRGDVIQSVGGSDLRSVGPSAVGLVMAESLEANEVRLGVLRGGREELELRVNPRPLPHATLELTASASMLDDGLAYLYVPSFTLAGTGQLAHALLAEMQRAGARSYVVDLRGNLGGSLSELGILMGAFFDGEWARALARGSVAWHATFEREGGYGTARLVADDGRTLRSAIVADPVKLDAPVVVIVDRRTSSAAEVAAAVLQASGRASVVGTATDGNVEVVQGFQLADGSGVLIAVANLELPDGASLDAGIKPDAVAAANVRELARGHDAALASAVAQLSGLPFTPGRWF